MKTFFLSRGMALTALTALLVLLSHTSASACAACYGDTSGSKMGVAAGWGIFAMVIIMFVMLGAVAAFGLNAVAALLLGHQALIRLVGGCCLAYLGLKTLRTEPATRAAAC